MLEVATKESEAVIECLHECLPCLLMICAMMTSRHGASQPVTPATCPAPDWGHHTTTARGTCWPTSAERAARWWSWLVMRSFNLFKYQKPAFGMCAFKPRLDHVYISKDVLLALNFNRAICWFYWELTISKQKKMGEGGHLALFM